ncbi:hypothetical protein [Spirosoma telluris]|uniref:hypothetical protein n=1 Tax=Spirosoma telluris TaxID=2183553 RepID=UPI002FC2FE85
MGPVGDLIAGMGGRLLSLFIIAHQEKRWVSFCVWTLKTKPIRTPDFISMQQRLSKIWYV